MTKVPGRETSGATWPGRNHEDLLLLLRGLLGRLLSGFLLCHIDLPPFLIAECKAEKFLRQSFFAHETEFYSVRGMRIFISEHR